MGKTISIKVLFGIYLLLMAGKVFAFSCNVDGGSRALLNKSNFC
jgi:TfoX/Sxy family transcriptional regulator of competence genes